MSETVLVGVSAAEDFRTFVIPADDDVWGWDDFRELPKDLVDRYYRAQEELGQVLGELVEAWEAAA